MTPEEAAAAASAHFLADPGLSVFAGALVFGFVLGVVLLFSRAGRQ
jgi:hypothetical protein